jgi:hypothetical protein
MRRLILRARIPGALLLLTSRPLKSRSPGGCYDGDWSGRPVSSRRRPPWELPWGSRNRESFRNLRYAGHRSKRKAASFRHERHSYVTSEIPLDVRLDNRVHANDWVSQSARPSQNEITIPVVADENRFRQWRGFRFLIPVKGMLAPAGK